MTNHIICPEFGPRLHALRTSKNLTIRQASELIGISHNYLSNMETSIDDVPALKTLKQIASVYNVKLQTLLEPNRSRVTGTGDLENSSIDFAEVKRARIDWAFQCVCSDQSLPCRNILASAQLSDAVKIAFIELYMQPQKRSLNTSVELIAWLTASELSQSVENQSLGSAQCQIATLIGECEKYGE